MKRRYILHITYWIFILLFLTVFFGTKWKSIHLAFYFACMLLPVVIGTTYVFNFYLVPKYLLRSNYKKFLLYFFYLLVLSLYLEILVALFAFVFIAKLNLNLVNIEGLSIVLLGITLYLIVFFTSFIKIALEYQKNRQQLEKLTTEKERNQQAFLICRADRKNQQIPLEDLYYVESLNDSVKVVTLNTEFITREKISKLASSLPTHFIRIHRSFVVNREHISSFSANEVIINNKPLPISRTYKKSAMELLKTIKS